jgi:protoporphyrinogen oxidase
MNRIVVVGGGITGLAAAHRVHELNPSVEVVLLEASDRLGGTIHTEHRDDFLLEFTPSIEMISCSNGARIRSSLKNQKRSRLQSVSAWNHK